MAIDVPTVVDLAQRNVIPKQMPAIPPPSRFKVSIRPDPRIVLQCPDHLIPVGSAPRSQPRQHVRRLNLRNQTRVDRHLGELGGFVGHRQNWAIEGIQIALVGFRQRRQDFHIRR